MYLTMAIVWPARCHQIHSHHVIEAMAAGGILYALRWVTSHRCASSDLKSRAAASLLIVSKIRAAVASTYQQSCYAAYCAQSCSWHASCYYTHV